MTNLSKLSKRSLTLKEVVLNPNILVLSLMVLVINKDQTVLIQDLAILTKDLMALTKDQIVLIKDQAVLTLDLAVLTYDLMVLTKDRMVLIKNSTAHTSSRTDQVVVVLPSIQFQEEIQSTNLTAANASSLIDHLTVKHLLIDPTSVTVLPLISRNTDHNPPSSHKFITKGNNPGHLSFPTLLLCTILNSPSSHLLPTIFTRHPHWNFPNFVSRKVDLL